MSELQPGSNAEWYALADDRVLARTLRELHYERLLDARAVDEPDTYEIVLPGGVRYRFVARPSAWGDLHVTAGQVVRLVDGQPNPGERPRTTRFLLDARTTLELDPIVLGNLLEEIHDTIAAEAQQCRRLEPGAAALARRSGVDLEQILDAHPKIIGSRGRLGFGTSDSRAYAPEHSPSFRIVWVGVREGTATVTPSSAQARIALLRRGLGDEGLAALLEAAREAGLHPERDALVPVHPWQWDRFVRAQYGAQLADGRLVWLGTHGEPYRPRASIRTLTSSTLPDAPDLKLSLTIMNTSCYRGIAAEHVEHGAALSRAVAGLVTEDAVLRGAGTIVLRDLGGVHVPLASQVETAGPYRYREMLGAIWREGAASRLGSDVVEVSAAALYQRDLNGDALARHWVEQSGVPAETWLEQLFGRTVVPLYHLLCRYGIGVIAHGQNISLVLRRGCPVGMILRDFHGDVRVVAEPWPEQAGLPHSVTHGGARRPPPTELVHDLFTGHFVSVLRFVAPVFDEHLGLGERRFYALARQVLHRYMAEHPELESRFSAAAMDAPRMARICVNRARFRIGYGDLASRPFPELGPPLRNPLAPTSPST